MKTNRVLALLAVVGVTSLLVISYNERGEGETNPLQMEHPGTTSSEKSIAVSVPPRIDAKSRVPLAKTRKRRQVSFQVIDAETKHGILQASIRVIAVDQNDVTKSGLWREQDWEVLHDSALSLAPDEQGKFVCNLPVDQTHVFVTACAPGYASRTIESNDSDIRIGLPRAQPVLVLVQTADSKPIAGATVTQTPLTRFMVRPTRGLPKMRKEWFSKAKATTDAMGRAFFSPLEFPCQFVAEYGNLSSAPVKGTLTEEHVTLILQPTILVYGEVHPPPGRVHPASVSIIIFPRDNQGGLPEQLLSSRDDGSWGPARVVVPKSGELRLKATSTGAAPLYRTISCPPPGEKVRVDFFLEESEDLFTRVIDESGEPVSLAVVYARWGVPGAWEYSRAYADESGLAVLACGNTLVALGAEAEGYYSAEISDILPSTTRDDPRLLTLVKDGTLTGRCTFYGPAPAEFKITFWDSERRLYGLRTFHNLDGSFKIDSVPAGHLQVLATELRGQTPTVKVEIHPGDEHEVVLAFGPSVTVTGTVADGSTGEPLVADIKLHAVSAGSPMYQYGPTHKSQTNGEFSISGLSIGENYLEFSSPGYAGMARTLSVGSTSTIETGSIRLLRTVNLEVQVSGHGDRGPCWLSLDGPEGERPQQRIPTDGVVHFDQLTPGPHKISFTEADQYGSFFNFELPASRRFTLNYHIPSSVELTVRALPESGETLPPASRVTVMQHDDSGHMFMRSKGLRDDNSVVIDAVFPGLAVVEISDANWQTIAVKRLALEPHSTNIASIRVGGDKSQFLVNDSLGKPARGAIVVFRLPDNESAWEFMHTVDRNGQLSLDAQDFAVLSAGIFSEPQRDLHNTIDLSSPGPYTLTLEAESRLSVTATDKSFPLSALDIFANAAGTGFYLQNIATDATGTLTWSNISAGPYVLEIEDSTLWPLTKEIQVSGKETHVDIDVRRKGNLLLTVRNETGTPVSDAPVSLTSIEFSTPVSTWLANDQILTSTGTLRTDESGQLRVSGVPNGEYTLEVNGYASSVTIPAWSTLDHEVALEPVH